MSKLEDLTEEIRKLREDVKELREAGGWMRIQYVPYPQYVPYYPQPSYVPWWGTQTIQITPCTAPTWTTYTITNNAGATTATATLPLNAQISLT